jgi:hypothetical protein
VNVNDIAEKDGEIIESKSEFARRTNVTPGRVTQWIDEGKITAAALDGEGRSARIKVRVALAQLNRSLDIDQRGGNGLLTNLAIPPALVESEGADGIDYPPSAPAVESIADRIQRERLEQLQRANRLARREEALAAGTICASEDISRAFGKLAAAMVAGVEGGLSEIATAFAARFRIPQRDALHLLRGEFRKVRATMAETVRRQSAELPATVTFELRDEESEHVPPDGRSSG